MLDNATCAIIAKMSPVIIMIVALVPAALSDGSRKRVSMPASY